MAKSKKTAKKSARKRISAGKQPSARRGSPNDAIALLTADHRQVEEWFDAFEASGSDTRKAPLTTPTLITRRKSSMREPSA
jgi:hypothetical protein